MLEFIKYCIKLSLTFMLHIFWVFPVHKDRLFFINDHSFSFSDNLKYLALYFTEKDREKYEIYFSLNDFSGIDNSVIHPVKHHSIKHFYYALTSSVLFTNMGGISYLPIRKKQLVINTWHGGGPYKVTGIDAINGYWYDKEQRYNAKKTDYILSSCRVFTEVEAKGMYYPLEKCINSGLPRNDILFDSAKVEELRKKVHRYYKLSDKTKIILYAPTFRGNFEDYSGVIANDLLEIDYRLVIEEITKKYGGDWVFAVRLHPKLKEAKFNTNDLINMSSYADAQELMAAIDILITDYSSVMWDFSLREEPCMIFATDINDYEIKRGFYIPPEEWPFPIATTNDELKKNIESFDLDDYRKKVNIHHEAVGSFEKGNACSIVLNLINLKESNS